MTEKTIEELERRLKEQEVARNDLDYENAKKEQVHQETYQKFDLFSSKQEVIRRGIESLMNILRLENRSFTSAHGVLPALEATTRKNAEKKLNEFIADLVIKPTE
jgi:hypothetical protein